MEFDIAVIGAGLSAGPIIERLAAARLVPKTLVIERGPRPWPDVAWQGPTLSTSTARWWTGPDPGGAARLWYGQVSRFCASDFIDPIPWPISDHVWDQNYGAIERLLRPYCADHLLNGTSVEKGDHITPRTRVARFESWIFQQLMARGVSAYSGQTCLGGHGWSADPVDPVTLEAIALTAPHAHERNWVGRLERLRDRTTPITWVQGYGVIALRPSGNGYEIEARSLDGTPWRVKARQVVLAAGVLETVPLLGTLPEISPLLGSAFTLTTELTAYIQTDIRRDSLTDSKIGRFAHVSAGFPFKSSTASAQTRTGKVSFYDALAFETAPRLERKLMALGVKSPRLDPADAVILKVSFKGRSQPSPRKRLEMSTDHRLQVVYAPTALDQELVRLAREAIEALAGDLPGARFLGSTDNVTGPDPTSAHFHGGAPFGVDPAKSVLDPICRVWGHPQIVVADASFMPGSGSTNSSLTVMANAWRIAEQLL